MRRLLCPLLMLVAFSCVAEEADSSVLLEGKQGAPGRVPAVEEKPESVLIAEAAAGRQCDAVYNSVDMVAIPLALGGLTYVATAYGIGGLVFKHRQQKYNDLMDKREEIQNKINSINADITKRLAERNRIMGSEAYEDLLAQDQLDVDKLNTEIGQKISEADSLSEELDGMKDPGKKPCAPKVISLGSAANAALAAIVGFTTFKVLEDQNKQAKACFVGGS